MKDGMNVSVDDRLRERARRAYERGRLRRALVAGIAIPLVAHRVSGDGKALAAEITLFAIVGGILLARFAEHSEGWRLAFAILALFVLYSVLG